MRQTRAKAGVVPLSLQLGIGWDNSGDRVMDPYRVLGVTRACTSEEVKAAFREGTNRTSRWRWGERTLSSSEPHTSRSWQIWIGVQNRNWTLIRSHKPLARRASRNRSLRPKIPTSPGFNASRPMRRAGARSTRMWLRKLGIIYLFYLVFECIFLVIGWIARPSLDLVELSRVFGLTPDALEFIWLITANLVALLFACIIAFKYDDA